MPNNTNNNQEDDTMQMTPYILNTNEFGTRLQCKKIE